MMTPEEYLQHYATRNDQAAFAEIVSHFTPLVYGLAMRRSGRAALPHLDEAMNGLGETDRTALLMRFYSGRTFPEIAGAMGRTEEGARKLCTRAAEKLSALLRLRGVALSAGALGTAMTADWASAAATVPSGLTASLTSHVLSQVTAPTAAATGAGGLISALTTMKSSTSVLTALLAWRGLWKNAQALRLYAWANLAAFLLLMPLLSPLGEGLLHGARGLLQRLAAATVFAPIGVVAWSLRCSLRPDRLDFRG